MCVRGMISGPALAVLAFFLYFGESVCMCVYEFFIFYFLCKISSVILERYQNCFHGVDLCALREQALAEYLRQPIVDNFDINSSLAKSVRYSLDFLESKEDDLYKIGN